MVYTLPFERDLAEESLLFVVITLLSYAPLRISAHHNGVTLFIVSFENKSKRIALQKNHRTEFEVETPAVGVDPHDRPCLRELLLIEMEHAGIFTFLTFTKSPLRPVSISS
jgi:hypothetical protein